MRPMKRTLHLTMMGGNPRKGGLGTAGLPPRSATYKRSVADEDLEKRPWMGSSKVEVADDEGGIGGDRVVGWRG